MTKNVCQLRAHEEFMYRIQFTRVREIFVSKYGAKAFCVEGKKKNANTWEFFSRVSADKGMQNERAETERAHRQNRRPSREKYQLNRGKAFTGVTTTVSYDHAANFEGVAELFFWVPNWNVFSSESVKSATRERFKIAELESEELFLIRAYLFRLYRFDELINVPRKVSEVLKFETSHRRSDNVYLKFENFLKFVQKTKNTQKSV